MRRIIYIGIAVLAVVFLSACGDIEVPDEPFVWPESTGGRSPFYDETLTIMSTWDIRNFRRFAEEYELRNPGVVIEFVALGSINTFEELEVIREQVGLELMGGTAPILIEGSLVDYLNPMTAQHFSDWRPIMHTDPNFHEDDWFMDAFDALSRDGGMMAFPIQYDSWAGNTFILANSMIPGLAEEFERRRSISLTEMMEIHSRKSASHPNMYIMRDFDALVAVAYYIDNFFDYETGRVDFASSEFIDLITRAREATSPNREFGAYQHVIHRLSGGALRGFMTYESHRYFFRRAYTFEYDIFSIFDEGMPFVNPLLYVTENDELLIRPESTMVLNATATNTQQALALDFLRFTLEAPRHASDDTVLHGMFSAPTWNLNSPNRHHARLLLTNTFISSIHPQWGRYNWRLKDTNLLRNVEVIESYIEAADTMPMRRSHQIPEVVGEAIWEIVHQFHDGLITAEAAANDLQNRVTLILMEMD